MRTTRAAIALAATALALVAAGCGDDESTGGAPTSAPAAAVAEPAPRAGAGAAADLDAAVEASGAEQEEAEEAAREEAEREVASVLFAPTARGAQVKRTVMEIRGLPTEGRRLLSEAEREANERSGAAIDAVRSRAYPRSTIGLRELLAGQRAGARYAAPGRGGRAPLAPAARWRELGPFSTRGLEANTSVIDPAADPDAYAVSGRVNAIAVAPGCRGARCVVYVGSSGGGVFKTVNGLAARPTWRPVGDSLPNGNVSAITIDPSDPSTIYVGTGQVSAFSTLAGLGVFRSRDGGKTWRPLNNVPFVGRGVGAIAVDPARPNTLYVGSGVAYTGVTSVPSGSADYLPGARPVGLYRSTNGGRSWQRVLARRHLRFDIGSVTEVRLDPRAPRRVWAAVTGYGLYRSNDRGAHWQRVFDVEDDLAADGGVVVDFDVARSRPDRLYVVTGDDANATSDLFRTDDARAARPRFTRLTSDDRTQPQPYSGWGVCAAVFPDPAENFSQCSYDLNIRVDPKRPSTVYLQGLMQYAEYPLGFTNGRGVIRSTDGGLSFTDMTADVDGRGMHPDNRALDFAADTDVWFAGSDGGVWRSDGTFVDDTASCATPPEGVTYDANQRGLCAVVKRAIPRRLVNLNPGLRTLEFMGRLAVAHDDPSIAIGGTQDNGTHVYTGEAAWDHSVGGDGGPAGIDAADHDTMYHQYFNPGYGSPEVSFRRGEVTWWNDISSNVVNSGEAIGFYAPLLAHPRRAGAMFFGGESVWRTLDSGGDRAYLEAHCNEYRGDLAFAGDPSCGDLQPIGTTADGGSTRLTSRVWGSTKQDGHVTALATSDADPRVLYAGTFGGRVFRTGNALATDPTTIAWERLDTRALPARGVSGIAADPTDPNRVYVAFTGYGRYTQRQPGHVFRGVLRGGAFAWRDISGDLPDAPVLDIAVDPVDGTVVIATDYGVLARPRTGGVWRRLGSGLPEGLAQVVGLTIERSPHRLYATTQSRGAFALDLG